MSFFECELLPEDPIFSLPIAFAKDERANKVNLGIGAYRTNEGSPLLLPSVKNAERQILEEEKNKEYLPIQGDATYIEETLKLIFGSISQRNRLFAAQTVGGTAALRALGEFCMTISKDKGIIYLPEQTWQNHHLVFRKAKLEVHTYPYYDPKTHTLNFSALCDTIKNMPAKSILLLHGCCHNPTGVDLSIDQWHTLSSIILKQGIIPFFDFAYQGFGEGLEEDARAIRYFFEQGHEMLLAYSFSKNFGLYGERAGLLAVVAKDEEKVPRVASHIKQIIRSIYSNPPLHAAKIVSKILSTESLRLEWENELRNMRERIQKMRTSLVEGLGQQKKNDYRFMNTQKGIFSYTGLSQEQVGQLREKYGIYMLFDGRMNIAGLNTHNLDYVIQAINQVIS